MDKEMNYSLNAEQQELVEQHLDLVSIIIRKYIRTNEQVRGLEYEDLYQYGCLALCKAAFHYDGRVKFETFAGTVIRNELLDECRKAKVNYSRSLSYDASVNSDDDDGDTFAGMLGDASDINDKLMDSLYTDDITTYKNIGTLFRTCDACNPVLEAEASLYLNKHILFER